MKGLGPRKRRARRLASKAQIRSFSHCASSARRRSSFAKVRSSSETSSRMAPSRCTGSAPTAKFSGRIAKSWTCLGYAAEEYIGRPIADFHVDQEIITDILARLVRGETLRDREARLRAKDGSTKHVLINSSGYFRDGKFVHSRCFTRDITERRKAEKALRDSERQLQLITDALPVCISYIDRDVRYRFVSAAYEQWFDRSKQELVGRRVEDVIGAGAYQRVGPYVERALGGETVTYQAEVPYLNSQTRFIEATYIPQLDENKQVVGLVALISDLSERKAFERFRAIAALRAERLVKITDGGCRRGHDRRGSRRRGRQCCRRPRCVLSRAVARRRRRQNRQARARGRLQGISQGKVQSPVARLRPLDTCDRCDSPRGAGLDPIAGGAAARLPAPRHRGHSRPLVSAFLSPAHIAGPHAGCSRHHYRRTPRSGGR